MSSHFTFLSNQDNRFNTQNPNMIPSAYLASGSTIPSAINNIAGTVDGNRINNPFSNMSSYFVSSDTPASITSNIGFCKGSTMDDLLGNQDPNAQLRCGWLYKPAATSNSPYPVYNKGHYGTVNGAINPPAEANGARWYWDTNEAKKKIAIDKCASMSACASVGDSTYSGCGWSLNKMKGVPIDSAGNSLYNDEIVFTPASRIVKDSTKCPAPPASAYGSATAGSATTGSGAQPTGDVCTKQLNTNRLGRDCIMRKVLDAGCSTSGTLYTALQGGNTNNYSFIGNNNLNNKQAYNTYQNRAQVMLDKAMLSNGNIDAGAALTNFRAVYDKATSEANDGLAFAARDLCLNAGEIDRFDFCSELSAGTRGPYSIECLQKLFRSKGGVQAGAWYPSAATITMYNTKLSWGDIERMLTDEYAAMTSPTYANKVRAYKNMKGINLDTQIQVGGA